MTVEFKSAHTLVAAVLFIILIFLIYSLYQSQSRSPAYGQVWSGPCGLQCITGASAGVLTPGLARVCVCQNCVCDLVSGVIRSNETLEAIQGALEGICDIACTQAKNVVDYVMSTDAPREVASTGILRAEVRSNRSRAYNAAPTFSERNELIPLSTERPDKDRVQPGDLSQFEETLAKANAKRSALTEGIKPEELEKTKEILEERKQVAKEKESEFITEIEEPSSSHASRKSCHSCAEENTVCLHDCPNEKKIDNDAEDLKDRGESNLSHPERPEHNQAENTGHKKLEEKLEKLAKIIISKSSLGKSNKDKPSEKSEIHSPCCQLDRDAPNTKGAEQASFETKPEEKFTVSVKEEVIEKVQVEAQLETPETELGDFDHISQTELPSSSHVSSSQKSCHSCAEGNTACLGECPNLKKTGDDKT